MRPHRLQIHLRHRDHVRCVADALEGYRVQIHDLGGVRWDLHVDIRSGSLPDVLAVIHQCLLDNDIALVRVTVDGRTYAMEPAAPV